MGFPGTMPRSLYRFDGRLPLLYSGETTNESVTETHQPSPPALHSYNGRRNGRGT